MSPVYCVDWKEITNIIHGAEEGKIKYGRMV